MSQHINLVAEQLLWLERELRVAGLWSEQAPDADALMSSEPFCVDRLDLEQWLQWVFLPRMIALVQSGQPLPAKSAIAPMALERFKDKLDKMQPLVKRLQALDHLLTEGHLPLPQ
ncbi:YqcC family protein [Pseudomonas sp. F1_0610]|uniref:YqcC family protein n=1 Tax=Pseudomonas sp. F1_0610 TaxID=3114284 RepID=UPI0039C231AB